MEYTIESVNSGIDNMIDDINELQEENLTLKRELLKYKAEKAKNKKQFDYIICTRKNGSQFIKIIYDSYDFSGWVEIGRINISQNEWVQDHFSINDIFDELK